MKAVMYDVFDPRFVVAKYDDVKAIYADSIVFNNGDEESYDPRYYGVDFVEEEVLAEDRQ